MTDKKKNGSDPTHDHDDGYRVDVPDDLLEEAVEAVERRVKPEESGGDVEVDLEATNPEAAADLENMSVEDMMAGGFLPEKVVTAFNESNSRVIEAQIAAKEAREKSAALLAESDSFRKRVQREKQDAVKFANEAILKEFLQILDNLERALHHTDSKPDGGAAAGGAVREGVEITLRQFLHLLQKFGVTRVPTAKGTPFDPHMHEAVQQLDSADLPNGSVAAVFQSGFMLNERLLRPAMVAVARNPNAAAQAAQPAQPTQAAAAEGAVEETEEEKLERIRRVGAAARAARAEKRAEREGQAADELSDAVGQIAQAETEDEKLERIRRVGAAARAARAEKKAERNQTASDVAAEAAGEAMSVIDETLNEQTVVQETEEERLERIRRVGAAARAARAEKKAEREQQEPQAAADGGAATSAFDADEETIAEDSEEAPEESEEEKLERIRRVGAAAREARAQKKAERAESESDAGMPPVVAAEIPTVDESPEEKLERIRRAGAAAREARAKKREERAEGSAAPAAAGGAAAPTPSFADEDLDNWESTVDAVRTDKQQGRR